MILNKISLKTKIILLSLTILLLSSGVMIFGIFKLNNTVEHFTHVSEINLPNSESLSSMLSTEKDIFNYYLLLSMNNGSDQKSIYEHLKKHIEVYEKADLWYQGIPFVEGEDELYQPVSKSWKVFKGLIEDQVNGKKVDLNDVVKANDDFESKLMKLIEFQGSEAKKWSAQAKEIAASTKWFQLVSVAILFVLATIVSVLIGSSLANQLKEIIALLTNISEAVESNSKSLSDSSNGISQAVVEQAASIEETAASLEEISSMIRKSTENARVTTEVSSQSQDKANEGKQVVEQMLSSMDSINSSNSEIENHILHSNEQMREIVRVIQEIGDKTKVINDIVFQTKLLSFNASVEAARAGEHGKGFAVVAEEVGSLASMSGNAAKEISDMLMNSMAKVENIVNETKAKVDQLVVQSKSSVQSGVEVANQCVIVLDEIVAQTVSVAQLSQEISTATQEQATGVGEINKAMNQLDQATQQNSTMAERTAKTAAELSSKAEQMRNIVDSLVVTVNGIE